MVSCNKILCDYI